MSSTRVLRSNCRNHGTGICTCPTQELPTTPRRSRSMSRTPSRAGSVAPPDLSFHGPGERMNGSPSTMSPTSNGSPLHSYYINSSSGMDSPLRSNQQLNSRSFVQDSDNVSLRDGDSQGRHRVPVPRFDDRSSVRSLSPSARSDDSQRSFRGIAAGAGRMIKVFNIGRVLEELDDEEEVFSDQSTLLHDSNASPYTPSLSPSPRMSSKMSTAGSNISGSSPRVPNGRPRHALHRNLISSSMSKSFEADSSCWDSHGHTEDEDSFGLGNLLTRIVGIECVTQMTSYSAAIATSLENVWLTFSSFLYWNLVNFFVCEKWLLHQQLSASTIWSHSLCNYVLKRLLPLFLIPLILVMLMSGYVRVKIPEQSELPFLPSRIDKVIPNPPSPPPVLPLPMQSCEVPDSSDKNNIILEKLVARILELEKGQEAYRRSTEEYYKRHMHMMQEKLEGRLQEEISKIEPATTTVVREIETIIKSEPVPVEREPIDMEKTSQMLIPMILPLIIDKMSPVVLRKIEEELSVFKAVMSTHEVNYVLAPSEPPSPLPPDPSGTSIDLNLVKTLIKNAIAKYDADKTGLADLALEPAGGSIVSTRCTKSSHSKNSVLTVWGWKIWSFSNSPRSIIQPGVVPGECWVVEGATAEVLIQLISPAIVTGFTLEHIPKAVSPYGKIDTAPQKFQVVGLLEEEDLESAWVYGTYEYLDNDEPAQYFPVQHKSSDPHPLVELRVLSNHGNVRSTCIYRFRVHGETITKSSA